MLARLDVVRMWAAVRDGVETTPPLADILVRAVNSLWGEGNIVSRIPAMIGFWTLCLCLFAFVRRRLDIAYAFAALLLPFSTGAYMYATEARCYGMLLGFCGVALVCWQSAAEGRRRAFAIPILALSLSAAIASHYYAFLLLLPLGGAELWRTARRKQFDWPVWAALCTAAIVGCGLCYAVMAGTWRFRAHPWATPQVQGLLGFYPSELQTLVTVFIAFLILTAGWWIFRGEGGFRLATVWQVPEHEVVMGVLFLMLPVAGFALAKVVTHMFTDRYFISAIIGAVVLSAFMAAIWTRGNRMVGVLLLLAATPPAAFEMAHHLPVRPVVDTEPLLRQALEQGPVIMDDGIHFFEEWYYLPANLKSRISYVADTELDAKWVGHDTVDVGMLELRKWYGMPILDYADVNVPGKTFRIYHNANGPVWLTNQLLHDGAHLEMLQSISDRSVLNATVPAR